MEIQIETEQFPLIANLFKVKVFEVIGICDNLADPHI